MAEMLVRGDGVERLRKLGKELKGADRTLRLEMAAAIRATAQPIVAEVRSAVMAIPTGGSHGGGTFARAAHATRTTRRGHGLRATIAAATGMQVRTTGKSVGVRIRINVAKLPPDQRTLPGHLDSPTGWRHPVFGDTNVWVHQDGHPYFKVTIQRHHAQARAQVEAAMDATAVKLTR